MSVPPVPDRRPIVRRHHGDEFTDDYDWLRDLESPEVLAHLAAETAYAEEQTADLADLRATIFEEIRARTRETDLSVPVRHGAWWYYSRTVEGQQYAIRARCPISDPDDWTPPVLDAAAAIDVEQILLDSNVEAEGHDFFSLGAFSLSDDDRFLAWSVDVTGDERYTIRVKDLTTGEVLPDEITGAAAGATWSAGASHLFYSTVDDAWRPHRIWRHRLGTPAADDTLVHEEADERFFTGVGRTQSEAFLVISSGSKITSEARVLRADDPEGEFTVVVPRVDGVEYSIEHAIVGGTDRLLLLHNATSPDFALHVLDLEQALSGTLTSTDAGEVLVPADPSRRLEDVDVFARYLVVSYRRDALTRIGVIAIGSHDAGTHGFGPLREVEFSEELFSCGVGGNAEWDQPLIRIGFGSFVTPSTVYDLNPDTFEVTLLKQAEVLGGYDPADYVQHRAWALADDGTRIPISIVARADTPRDGSAPALIYGYGAYEISIDPALSVARLSLLDRGFVFAVAHVRGGGELGRAWYEQGRLAAKVNSFFDFVACARHLVAEGWTSADRLVAEGGSAGGLLMGAVTNLAPDAFAGVVAAVPFVDALTTILDPSMPLTVIEWDEWGNPLQDPEIYRVMKSYTPYENVRAVDYPPILAIASLHDTRVHVVEPAKWVARLREVGTGDHPVLFRVEMKAGHGGVSGRYASWHERAWELAWIIRTATGATS